VCESPHKSEFNDDVEWDMYKSKVGMISFLRPVAALFKKMSKQEITELATSIGKDATNDAALFMTRLVFILVRFAYEELFY
jgi:hypothetical protein